MMRSVKRLEMARRPSFTGGGACGGGERVWKARVSKGAATGALGLIL
jgi:hypothetical protein